MNVFKPTSLLLALRISILVFLEYNFFILKSDFLQAHIMLEKSEKRRSLVEIGIRPSECALITKPNYYILTNKTMEKPAVASESPYIDSVIFIFLHLQSHTS